MKAFVNIRGKKTALIVLAVFGMALLPVSGFCQTTIDMAEWFIISDNSKWHYSGEGQPGSTADDDFTWKVLSQKKDIGGVQVTSIQTIGGDESEPNESHPSHMNEDYWFVDGQGTLFYYGAKYDDENRDLYFHTPVRIGGAGQEVPSTEISNETIVIYENGVPLDPHMVNVSIDYKELIAKLETPMGVFDNVLHITFNVIVQQTILMKVKDLYLKKGVGVILQDHNLNPNIDEIQALDSGMVAGQTIVQDGATLYGTISGLQILTQPDSDPGVLLKMNRLLSICDAYEQFILAELQAAAGQRMILASPAFDNNGELNNKYLFYSDKEEPNNSPPLFWYGVPSGTQSFAILMQDSQNDNVHWLVYDIPSSVTSLSSDAGRQGGVNLPEGAKHGTNYASYTKYFGPSVSSTYPYIFKVFALDLATLGAEGQSWTDIQSAMAGHVLAEGMYQAMY